MAKVYLMAKFFNPMDWFKVPRIPKSLQTEFEVERLTEANRYIDFLLKYVGWVVVFLYSSIDFFFSRPENRVTLFLIRLTVIPLTVFLYKFKNNSLSQKYPNFRIYFVIFYSLILIHTIIILNSLELIYPYAGADHLGAVLLVVFLQMDLKSTIYTLLGVYVPYFIILAVRDFQFGPILFIFNTALGISITMICNSLLRERSWVSEFLARQQSKNDALIGENISQISHDARAPLLALQTVREGLFSDSEMEHILKASVGRLIELVEDITQAASSLQINIQTHDLNEFIKECREYGEFLHPKQSFVWEANLEEKNYPFDKNKIKRVVINLINNAVKARGSTAAPIAVRFESGENLSVSVIDTGIGFSEDTQVFKKGVSKFGGSGLGLHFCQQVIHEHGGQITGRHQNGITTFNFTL